MQVISLFSGIGGFELAAEWMGWENISSCEIDLFCQKVLKYYWPDSYHHGDIKTIDYQKIRNKIKPNESTVVVGGFPCQPYSAAGKRKGTEDDRHLWPYCVTTVRELHPAWCVFENVRGLTNWNGGVVFDQVQADLEAEGYEVLPFLLPACGVNAPHRRDRIFFIAYSCSNGQQLRGFGEDRFKKGESESIEDKRERIRANTWGTGEPEFTSNTGSKQFQERTQNSISEDRTENRSGMDDRAERPCNAKATTNIGKEGLQRGAINGSDGRIRPERNEQFAGLLQSAWEGFPTVTPIRSINDGVSGAMVRNIKPEIYATITNRYTGQDLQKVWNYFQSKEIREQMGRFYKIHDPGLLLQTVQLCKAPDNAQGQFSSFSEKACEGLLRKLSKYGEFRCTPQGLKLEKQFNHEFGDTLPYLSHEIALATKEIEKELKKYLSWHRNESIKAYGNAVVPQLVYKIFKAIQEYDLRY